MGSKKSNDNVQCLICGQFIPEDKMGEAEMIAGPDGKKVFVHTYHKGVRKEAQEEYK